MAKKETGKKTEKLKTVNVKGKQYVTVNERIRYFNEAYQNGAIMSQIMAQENNTVLIKAIVIPNVEQKERQFTGYAQETKGKGMVNTTSYIENCETSAIGRALGFMGIGVETSIASAEEVANAIARQKQNGSDSSEIKPPEEIDTEGDQNPSGEETLSKNPNEGGTTDDWGEGEKVSNLTTDKQKTKETSKEDILTVEEICNKAPGQVTSKDLQKAFKIMKTALGKQLFDETLETFGKKSIADIKKAATGQVILQIMIGKWHAERKAGDE